MIAPLTPGLLGATASTAAGQAGTNDAGIEDAAKQLEGVFMSMLVDAEMKRFAKAPDWMSASTSFMCSFTDGSMTRGPDT